MKVIESLFYNETLRFIGYGSSFGWHERNAGNISYRLTKEEVSMVYDDFSFERPWVSLPNAVSDMANEFVFTTITGCYFIDIQNEPETKFCVCEISGDGSAYRIVWGGIKPTSELSGHLLSLGELKKRNSGRAVYHCHPANIIALSYLLPQDDEIVSNVLWESETECPFVFPEGIGVVGFNVPGSFELAKATAEKIKDYNAVLWSFHGIFASGESIASAFGLAHAIEKAAEIKLKVISSGIKPLNIITKEQQEITASTYGFKLNDFK